MALVINRKPGQAINIGADVVVQIVETHRSWVSVRVHAPLGTTILRAELANTIPAPPKAPEVLKVRKSPTGEGR